jgi:hypothetical protein
MAVRKLCERKGKGCEGDCKHPLWLDLMYGGRRYRMPVDDFAFPRMPEGERKAVTRFEAERRWEPRFRAEIMAGNDPTASAPTEAPDGVSSLIDEYQRLHCEASRLHLSTLKPLLGRLKDQLGKRQIRELEDPRIIESLKSDMLKNGREPATINRYLAQLRHMTNWAMGRGYLSVSPFYNKLRNPTGVRLLKGEKIRTRRLVEGEEDALLKAADSRHHGSEEEARRQSPVARPTPRVREPTCGTRNGRSARSGTARPRDDHDDTALLQYLHRGGGSTCRRRWAGNVCPLFVHRSTGTRTKAFLPATCN